jgi:hypothetical protein
MAVYVFNTFKFAEYFIALKHKKGKVGPNLIKHHTMKIYRVEAYLHAFLTSALERRMW